MKTELVRTRLALNILAGPNDLIHDIIYLKQSVNDPSAHLKVVEAGWLNWK